MKIAQVSPLYESVPPQRYGGTERVVSYLTEQLVEQGHEVTLFASGDSVTQAELVSVVPTALRLGTAVDWTAPHVLQLEKVMQRARDFDIIHFHTDYTHFPISRRVRAHTVTTLHGRLDIPELQPIYKEFCEMPVVSISDNQRLPIPDAHWTKTIHHGLPENLFRVSQEMGTYLAFLGRISPEKRVDRAIEIAHRVGLPLKIAAKIDRADRTYFEKEIRPLLCHPNVEFLGEVSGSAKERFLANALALLFPIDWPEPFGLVMIEAMACGTPVIAFRGGSVCEVIQDGVSGFIVDSIEEAVLAVARIPALSRGQCRREFERRFTSRRMTRNYLEAYQSILCVSHAASA